MKSKTPSKKKSSKRTTKGSTKASRLKKALVVSGLAIVVTVICLWVAALSGCSALTRKNPALIYNPAGVHVKRCHFPVYIFMNMNLPAESQWAVQAAAKNWNKSLGMDAFIVLGMANLDKYAFDNFPLLTVSIADPRDRDIDNAWAYTQFEVWDRHNCIDTPQIVINVALSTSSINMQTLVLTHEFGHVLGLNDYAKGGLMYPTVSENSVNRLQLSPAEIDLLERLYGDKNVVMSWWRGLVPGH